MAYPISQPSQKNYTRSPPTAALCALLPLAVALLTCVRYPPVRPLPEGPSQTWNHEWYNNVWIAQNQGPTIRLSLLAPAIDAATCDKKFDETRAFKEASLRSTRPLVIALSSNDDPDHTPKLHHPMIECPLKIADCLWLQWGFPPDRTPSTWPVCHSQKQLTTEHPFAQASRLQKSTYAVFDDQGVLRAMIPPGETERIQHTVALLLTSISSRPLAATASIEPPTLPEPPPPDIPCTLLRDITTTMIAVPSKRQTTVSKETSLLDTPVLIVFWATWCEPCVAEFPKLLTLEEQYRGRLRILALAREGRPSFKSVATFADNNAVTFPVYVEDDGNSAAKYVFGKSDIALPGFAIFRRDGRLDSLFLGSINTPANYHKLESGIARVIQGPLQREKGRCDNASN